MDQSIINPPDFTQTSIIPEPIKKSFPKWPLIAFLFFVLGITSVFAYQKYQPARSNLAGPSLSPFVSPALSEVERVEDPTANWQTYSNINLGFRIKYPSTVRISTEYNDQYNRATEFQGSDIAFTVMLRKTGDIDLEKYFFMDAPISSKGILGDKSANIYLYEVSGDCVNNDSGPSCPKSFIGYVARNGNDLYHLSFFGDTKLSDIENQILSTFKFLGAGTEVCQPIFPVETNTQEMTASQDYALECTLKKTAGDCLSVDIYNQPAKDFSQPDGESDCRWVISP